MARALSQIVTVVRGSVGGLTFTANQWHQILLRAKTSPVQPQTNPQSWIKNAFSAASNAWKLLLEPAQLSWGDYADTVTYTGPLGEYTIPGRQIFMASQSLVNYINAASLDTITPNLSAPVIPGRATFSEVSIGAPDCPGDGVGLTLDAPLGEKIQYLAEISPGFNPSRKRYTGPFKGESAQSAPVTPGTPVKVNFLGLTVGLAYFVRVRGVVVDDPARLTKITILRHIAETTVV